MSWIPPDDYQPIPGVARHWLNMVDLPRLGTAEFRMLVMVTHNKMPQDVGLTKEMAQSLIDKKLVTTGLYPAVLAVALGVA